MDSLPTTETRAWQTPLHFVETFPKNQGISLVEHGTRCGRPNCRCTRGQLHRTAYLRWRDRGTQRRRYVRKADRDAVQAALDRRRLDRHYERMTWQQAARLLEQLDAVYRTAADGNGGEQW